MYEFILHNFARTIKGADIAAHEKVVLNGKNAECSYEFARFISDADIGHVSPQIPILSGGILEVTSSNGKGYIKNIFG